MKSHRNEERQQKKSFNSQVSNLQPFKNIKQKKKRNDSFSFKFVFQKLEK